MYDQKEAEKDWNLAYQMFSVNYVGAASILEIAAADMEKQGKGTIIGISSVAGDRGRGSNYLYGSAKAGFTAYLSGLRNRLFSSGVHVLTVKPGFVYTAMTAHLPLPKPLTAQPHQVAKDIFRAAQKQKNVIYTLWMWRYVMMIIRNIPEFIFKKLKL
jgi:short-subunit dehydrogenase